MTTTIETHEEATEAEVDEIVRTTLAVLGIGLDDLKEQAKLGRFASEAQRRAWFLVSGLVASVGTRSTTTLTVRKPGAASHAGH